MSAFQLFTSRSAKIRLPAQSGSSFPKSKPVSTAPMSTWVHFLYSGRQSTEARDCAGAWKRDGVISAEQQALISAFSLDFNTVCGEGEVCVSFF